MKPTTTYIVPELSRPLKVERVPLGGIEETILATQLEREELAKRFGLLDLSRFEAYLNVDRARGKMFAVTGWVSADVVQECVVTLEPVAATVKENIDVLFAPPSLLKDDREGPLGDASDYEAPEPIENGTIDLGELAAQHMAMALNPYPRKKGARIGVLEVKPKKPAAEIAKLNPFAKLKAVKPTKK